MPADRLALLVQDLISGVIRPEDVPFDVMTHQERSDFSALLRWELRRVTEQEERRRRIPAQRKGYRLLRSLLDSDQKAMLARSRRFLVRSVRGNIYRLWPHRGLAERVEKHGSRWFVRASYCLHDLDRTMPPVDVTIGHLLWLRSNEDRFVAMANVRQRDLLWNGEWLRRLYRTRTERAAMVAATVAAARDTQRNGSACV